MKTIVVSGPGRGLGLAISRRLVADGYFVVGVGRTNSSEFKSLIATSGTAAFVEYDLEDLNQIAQLVSGISKKYGAIYGLVNNAGVGVDGFLATQHSTDISRILTVNLQAAILLSKGVSRPMLVRKEGRIVNISSIIASTGFSGLAVYAASKAGLEGFSRSLSRELGRAGITVNCVAPGYMETEMTQGLGKEKLSSIKRRAPLGLPLVEDVAGSVSFLMSSDAEKITGSVVTVDGGSTA